MSICFVIIHHYDYKLRQIKVIYINDEPPLVKSGNFHFHYSSSYISHKMLDTLN